MRRPHVFERSAPRLGREGRKENVDTAVAARLIAAQLGSMIARADQAGLVDLWVKLEAALLEAEKLASGST